MKNLDLEYNNVLKKIENPIIEAFTEFLLDLFNGKSDNLRQATEKYTLKHNSEQNILFCFDH